MEKLRVFAFHLSEAYFSLMRGRFSDSLPFGPFSRSTWV